MVLSLNQRQGSEMAEAKTIHDVVQRQREFFMTGATLDVDYRVDALKRLRASIKAHEKDIADALYKDLRKSELESYMSETGMVLDEIKYELRHIRKWSRTKRVKTPIAQFISKSFVVPQPYGVVLIMAPWNYPVQLCLEPLVGAVAAGNVAIVKPSAYAAEVSRCLANIVEEVFLPEYVAVVEGGREQNTQLLEEKFDYIFFTGSETVGKIVMEKASRHLTPVSLELGGKSPVIVDRTANLEVSARRLAFGKYLNAGQTCVAPDYLLIERSVKDNFLECFERAVSEFFPKGDFSNMPVIVNDRHFKRLMDAIDASKAKGAKVFMGGNGDMNSRFIEPTVLDDVSWDSPVMEQEIFGPILPVIEYEDLDSVLNAIKQRPKPLALYLFSNDKAVQCKVLSSIPYGGGCVNDTIIHLATPYMGFGGVGESGMGSYHGKRSFDTFTHYKSIVKKSNVIDLPMRYHPYSKKKLSFIKKVMK